MAAAHISDLADMENSRPAFRSDKYSLLVIVGHHGTTEFVDLLVSEIERGNVFLFLDLYDGIQSEPVARSIAPCVVRHSKNKKHKACST